jgi:hypothetical protein
MSESDPSNRTLGTDPNSFNLGTPQMPAAPSDVLGKPIEKRSPMAA